MDNEGHGNEKFNCCLFVKENDFRIRLSVY